MADKIFANGLVAKLPAENAPSFVKMKLSFKVADFAAFMSQHESNSGWINVSIKEAQNGKIYGELDQYVKQEAPNLEPTIEYPTDEIDESSVPF